MRQLMISVLILAGMALPASTANPCCAVTGIDARTGIVTAKETAAGRTFQFKVTNAVLLKTLHAGSPVYANFSTKQVSLDGNLACCAIVSIAGDASKAASSAPHAASAFSTGFKCDPDSGVCYCTGGPTSPDCQALGSDPRCGTKIGCDGSGRCFCIPPVVTKWSGTELAEPAASPGQSQAPVEKLAQNVIHVPPLGGVDNKQVDPCTIASGDTLKALLQSGIQAYFPYSVSQNGKHINISSPSVEQVTCPHMSITVHANVQYRETRGFPQFQTGGSLDLASPVIADVQFESFQGATTVTASDLRQATAVLTNPQITSLKIADVPSWLEPSWIRECLNGQFSDWGCTDVLQTMKFDVTNLVELYLQQGHTL